MFWGPNSGPHSGAAGSLITDPCLQFHCSNPVSLFLVYFPRIRNSRFLRRRSQVSLPASTSVDTHVHTKNYVHFQNTYTHSYKLSQAPLVSKDWQTMVLTSFTSSLEIDVGITFQASTAAETNFTAPLIQNAIARCHLESQPTV